MPSRSKSARAEIENGSSRQRFTGRDVKERLLHKTLIVRKKLPAEQMKALSTLKEMLGKVSEAGCAMARRRGAMTQRISAVAGQCLGIASRSASQTADQRRQRRPAGAHEGAVAAAAAVWLSAADVLLRQGPWQVDWKKLCGLPSYLCRVTPDNGSGLSLSEILS